MLNISFLTCFDFMCTNVCLTLPYLKKKKVLKSVTSQSSLFPLKISYKTAIQLHTCTLNVELHQQNHAKADPTPKKKKKKGIRSVKTEWGRHLRIVF